MPVGDGSKRAVTFGPGHKTGTKMSQPTGGWERAALGQAATHGDKNQAI